MVAPNEVDMQEKPTLVQFRFSHFNEKARWALDYKGVDYNSQTLLPGRHYKPLRALGNRTTPVLLRDGKVIGDSTEIIAALESAVPEPALYPADPDDRARALEIEDYCDAHLGPPVRHCMFCISLPHSEFYMNTFAAHLRGPSRWLIRVMIRLMRGKLRDGLNLTEEAFAESCASLREACRHLEGILHGRDYLVGDRFTVADLTAAALLAPMAMPAEAPHTPRGRLAEPIAAFLAEWERETPLLAWSREVFRKHRPVGA